MRQKLIMAGFAAFLAVYLVCLTAGGFVKNVPFEEISRQMVQADEIGDLDKQNAKALRRNYGITEEMCDGYFYYKAKSFMAVEEILIVKSKDGQAEEVMTAAGRHLEAQKESFDGYGVSQTALLKKAVLERKGNYVIYAVGEESSAWQERFWKLVR